MLNCKIPIRILFILTWILYFGTVLILSVAHSGGLYGTSSSLALNGIGFLFSIIIGPCWSLVRTILLYAVSQFMQALP